MLAGRSQTLMQPRFCRGIQHRTLSWDIEECLDEVAVARGGRLWRATWGSGMLPYTTQSEESRKHVAKMLPRTVKITMEI